MHIQEKRSCTQTRPNSLANAPHAASEFQKQRSKFLSINIITKYFAIPCKVQKTTKNISFPDVIPPFCSKSRAVYKNNIVVVKFHMPYPVAKERSICSPYQWEFILPYPLLLRFPCSLASKCPTCSTMHWHCICIHIIIRKPL